MNILKSSHQEKSHLRCTVVVVGVVVVGGGIHNWAKEYLKKRKILMRTSDIRAGGGFTLYLRLVKDDLVDRFSRQSSLVNSIQ